MLSKSYKKCIYGKNYISLAYGIQSIKAGYSCLLVDDHLSLADNKWITNIGLLELKLYGSIGQKQDITAFKQIAAYAGSKNTLLNLNDKLIELGASPYANLKELARKIPETFHETYVQKIEALGPAKFDQLFEEFLEEIAQASILNMTPASNVETVIKTILVKEQYQDLSFIWDVSMHEQLSKQLHFALQMMFQSTFSAHFHKTQNFYLILSLLSPRFEINTRKLEDDLLYQFQNLDGDYKRSTVVNWGIECQALEYILLNSVDGLIQVDETYYFANEHERLPFKSTIENTTYKSIKIRTLIDHDFIDLFKDKRIIFSSEKRMGSDFPYWEMTLNEHGELKAIFSYADQKGTKASFYYHNALDTIYQSLVNILPGIDRLDWQARSELSLGDDIWFEYKNFHRDIMDKDLILEHRTFVENSEEKSLGKIYQCNPKRSRSLGLYFYLLEIF